MAMLIVPGIHRRPQACLLVVIMIVLQIFSVACFAPCSLRIPGAMPRKVSTPSGLLNREFRRRGPSMGVFEAVNSIPWALIPGVQLAGWLLGVVHPCVRGRKERRLS